MSHVITISEYLGQMPERYPDDFDDEIVENSAGLLEKVNLLLSRIPDIYFVFAGINSGWRPKSYNDTVANASKTSKHISAQAIDLRDPQDRLDTVLFTHQDILVSCGLYAEWPDATPLWCHLQSVAPRSGNSYFHP